MNNKQFFLATALACAGAAISVCGCRQSPPPPALARPTIMPGRDFSMPISGGPHSPRPGSYLRATHLVAGGQRLQLTINGRPVADAVAYGASTNFVAVAPGSLTVGAIAADGKTAWGPHTVEAKDGVSTTLAITAAPGPDAVHTYTTANADQLPQKPQIAYVHAADGVPYIATMVDSSRFRNALPYGSQTEYYAVGPGKHTVEVDYDEALPPLKPPPGAPQNPNGNRAQLIPIKRRRLLRVISMERGRLYTVLVFNHAGGKPQISVSADRFGLALPGSGGFKPHGSTP